MSPSLGNVRYDFSHTTNFVGCVLRKFGARLCAMRYQVPFRSAGRAAPANNCSSDAAQFISERIIPGVQCNGMILKNGRISSGTGRGRRRRDGIAVRAR